MIFLGDFMIQNKKLKFWVILSIFEPKFCIYRKFCQFSNGHHRLQFRPFDNPILHAQRIELGLFSEFFGEKLQFFQFLKGHHQLQF